MKWAFLACVAVVAVGAAWTAPADAALISCPASFTADGTAKVYNGGSSAASACQYDDATDQSDVASESNINSSGFFGQSDWEFNPGQGQMGGAGNTGTSGTWSIANVDFATYDYIIVFKDGNPTHLTAFLFNEAFASGSWLSPFTSDIYDVNNPKNVSHITIARRANPTDPDPDPVPEPGALGILGLGLLGLGLVRRRLTV